jgi:hypothetical protein
MSRAAYGIRPNKIQKPQSSIVPGGIQVQMPTGGGYNRSNTTGVVSAEVGRTPIQNLQTPQHVAAVNRGSGVYGRPEPLGTAQRKRAGIGLGWKPSRQERMANSAMRGQERIAGMGIRGGLAKERISQQGARDVAGINQRGAAMREGIRGRFGMQQEKTRGDYGIRQEGIRQKGGIIQQGIQADSNERVAGINQRGLGAPQNVVEQNGILYYGDGKPLSKQESDAYRQNQFNQTIAQNAREFGVDFAEETYDKDPRGLGNKTVAKVWAMDKSGRNFQLMKPEQIEDSDTWEIVPQQVREIMQAPSRQQQPTDPAGVKKLQDSIVTLAERYKGNADVLEALKELAPIIQPLLEQQ